MTEKTDFDELKEKATWFRTTWGVIFLLACLILPLLAYLAFFWWFDHWHQYGALISQSVLATAVSIICYSAMRHILPSVRTKSKKSQVLPGWATPLQFAFIFAPWYALSIHPLLVSGNALCPLWVAIPLALFILILTLLMRRPAIQGEMSMAQLLSISLIFPQERTRVDKGIYSYIRHPAYANLLLLSFGFALLRNNWLAIFTALIFLIPNFVEIKLEDQELIAQFGEEHRRYAEKTPAIFPHLADLGKFLKLIIATQPQT